METLFEGKYKYKGLGFDFDMEKEDDEWKLNYLCARIHGMDKGYCECSKLYNQMRTRIKIVLADWEGVFCEASPGVRIQELKKIILAED